MFKHSLTEFEQKLNKMLKGPTGPLNNDIQEFTEQIKEKALYGLSWGINLNSEEKRIKKCLGKR